jgi:hypothetical protein
MLKAAQLPDNKSARIEIGVVMEVCRTLTMFTVGVGVSFGLAMPSAYAAPGVTEPALSNPAGERQVAPDKCGRSDSDVEVTKPCPKDRIGVPTTPTWPIASTSDPAVQLSVTKGAGA